MTMPRQSTCFAEFEAAVSTARLQPYGLGVDPPADVCARYLWNVALCESLYPALNFFEIALRNAIHAAAAQYFGTPLWFDTVTRWNGLPLWGRIQQDQLVDAKRKLTNAGKALTAEGIVAELSFSFWTGIFNQPYERPLSVHIIRHVFPTMPRVQRRPALIKSRLSDIRDLRNRIFHYEPIWQRSLPTEHAEIYTLLRQVNPTISIHARMVDRFATIWTSREQPYRAAYMQWVSSLKP